MPLLVFSIMTADGHQNSPNSESSLSVIQLSAVTSKPDNANGRGPLLYLVVDLGDKLILVQQAPC